MKTIAQILPSLKQGGVETGTIEIATALKKAGIPNIVISAGGPMVALLKKINVPHIELPVNTKNPIKMFLNTFKIIRVCQQYNVGLMHVRSRAPAWSVKWASKRSGIPFIASYHGVYGIKPAIKKIYNSAMLGGVLTIAVSHFVKQHLMDVYHYPEDKIRVIPRGADLNRFNPEKIPEKQMLEFVKKYQIPFDKPVITLVGRLSKIKGQRELIQAIKKMKHKEVTCLLVGGGAAPEYQQELSALIHTLPEETNLKIISVPSTEMPLVYKASDIVVSARITPEAFGRTISEANAMKKIVVAFNHGGPTETIINGKTGFLTPVGDILALAKALDSILDMKPADKRKMEEAAYQNATTNFSIQKMCDSTISVYREILK